MRSKKLSISDMTERVTFKIPQGERDEIGGFKQTSVDLMTVWADVRTKTKSREMAGSGELVYYQAYEVKIRPANIAQSDLVSIRGKDCAIISAVKENNYIKLNAERVI